MYRAVACATAILLLTGCDRASIRNFLHRLKTKPRHASDAITAVAKDQDRHDQFVARARRGDITVLFLGDSLTEWFATIGEESWNQLAEYRPVNFGVSGDRTENLLWRITHGELDGIDPKVVVILVGTNNIGQFEDERPEWIAAGIKQILVVVHEKLPNTKVLLFGIFPRDGKGSRGRQVARDVNELLRGVTDDRTRFVDISHSFLDPEGNISSEIMPDQLHLTARGYEIWLRELEPILRELTQEKIESR